MSEKRIKGILSSYLHFGHHPGDSLVCLLANEPFGFLNRADDDTIKAIKKLAIYIRTWPETSWGSRDAVNEWIRHRGLAGLPEENDLTNI